MVKTLILCASLILFLSSPMQAQAYGVGVDAVISDSTEFKAVEASILGLFDGMRAADTTLIRSVMHPQSALFTVASRPDGTRLVPDSGLAPFLNAVAASGSSGGPVWDERIANLKVLVDGDMATAWMEYRFYRGEDFSHCGVNTMNLIKSDGRWLIFSIADTRRREGC